jgi:glutamyl-tRNA reductase
MTDRLFVVGLNHLKADLGCRERLAVQKSDLAGALETLKDAAGADELVVLSTCSRVEVYGRAHDTVAAKDALVRWFVSRGGEPAREALYVRRGESAARHLFRVAAGLDSWIIGETEILGQIKQAYLFAQEKGFTGSALNRLFQKALASGKQVRATTGIQNGIHSIGGAAALLAKRIFGEEGGGTVVVFGAGQAAEAVVRHLIAKNFKKVFVANRTLEKGRELADKLGGTAVSFEEGIDMLRAADVGIFSLSTTEAALEEKRLQGLAAERTRSLFLIDLGMPRNVAPGCASLDNVYLYDLDNLKEMVQDSLEVKAVGKQQAEVLVVKAAAECCEQIERSALVAGNGGGRI